MGAPPPGVNDVVAHGDKLRELALELQRQRGRAASAAALRDRMQSAGDSTTLAQVKQGLQAARPFATATGDKLFTAVEKASSQHGAECCVGAPLPTDVAVYITTNALSECNAIIGAANDAANELQKLLADAAADVKGPTLDAVVKHRLRSLASQKHLAHASVAHLPVRGEDLKVLCNLVAKAPFLGMLDLTGCFITDQGVAAELLPTIAGHQHLTAMSLSHNGLSVSVGQALAERLSSPDFCPSLVSVALDGNDFAPRDVEAIADALTERVRARQERRSRGVLRKEDGKTRVLCLDGGGQQAVLQLEWLMSEQRRLQVHGGHVADEYDLIVASGWGAVIACGLAMRRPLAAIDDFFSTTAGMFHETHRTYYAEKAARAVRGWFTGGNFYNKEYLHSALKGLFRDSRFDFTDTNVILPLLHRPSNASSTSLATLDGGDLRVVSAWQCASPTLQHADLIDHEASSLLIADVLLCALSTPTLFAPTPAPKGIPDGGLLSDVTPVLPNPSAIALLEASATANAQAIVTSVSANPAPLPVDAATSTCHVICGTLDAFPADRDAAHVRLQTVVKYAAEAAAGSAQAFRTAQPQPGVEVRRVVLQHESTANGALRFDEGDSERIKGVRQAVGDELHTASRS
eukprot:CAMPEP_0174852694 /NCGR_PEP_ID=MMETSP1114-20130205/26360_1 /TAXON_ID=312471 /ORGANISM="Neobodo designis, Strain CCAP 1951/1" /LENGTH=633 /DNA_ID=CAMNT_0016087303 /DNA_START=96 /DNA_END=1997 /DNA_ORIENTATION=+